MGKPSNNRTVPDFLIIEGAGIGINSEENIATMNREAHWYIHTSLYHASVECYLTSARDTSDDKTLQDAAVHLALATLKTKLEYL
ncbi:MAG: hypothetical protein IJ025_01065 [Clostridia bacterium]|nr:hypothetical protein [Clostridia bacterium]